MIELGPRKSPPTFLLLLVIVFGVFWLIATCVRTVLDTSPTSHRVLVGGSLVVGDSTWGTNE